MESKHINKIIILLVAQLIAITTIAVITSKKKHQYATRVISQ